MDNDTILMRSTIRGRRLRRRQWGRNIPQIRCWFNKLSQYYKWMLDAMLCVHNSNKKLMYERSYSNLFGWEHAYKLNSYIHVVQKWQCIFEWMIGLLMSTEKHFSYKRSLWNSRIVSTILLTNFPFNFRQSFKLWNSQDVLISFSFSTHKFRKLKCDWIH